MLRTPARNTLYYGDNLAILREHVEDESVDLVYLDPPFNSNANYNLLFKAPDGHQSQAQIEAFDDTWHWNEPAEQAFDEVMQSGNSDAAEMLRAMRSFLKENDMMAYLTMMAVRLCGVASRAEANGLALSALRSDREPLPQNSPGCDFRADNISVMKSFGRRAHPHFCGVRRPPRAADTRAAIDLVVFVLCEIRKMGELETGRHCLISGGGSICLPVSNRTTMMNGCLQRRF